MASGLGDKIFRGGKTKIYFHKELPLGGEIKELRNHFLEFTLVFFSPFLNPYLFID